MHGARPGVVDEVVDHRAARAALEERVALCVVSEEVADDQHLRDVVVDERALGVLALRVRRIRQALGDDVVAESDAMGGAGAPLGGARAAKTRTRGRQVLVGRPREGAVIDDDVVRSAARRQSVDFPVAALGGTGFAGTHANVLDDDVVRPDADATANNGDARCGRGLARDGHMRLADRQVLPREVDDPADLEDDHAPSGSLQGSAQRAGSAGGEAGDTHHLAAAAAVSAGPSGDGRRDAVARHTRRSFRCGCVRGCGRCRQYRRADEHRGNSREPERRDARRDTCGH